MRNDGKSAPGESRRSGAPGRGFLLLLAGILGAAGCAGTAAERRSPNPSIARVVGSDTMEPLVHAWSEAFMKTHADVSVRVEGGGTRRGIEALIDGRTDLCAASRTMQANEVKRLLDSRGFLGLSILTAKDALSVYVHPENPVTGLGLAELKAIFTGNIANWKEVGGEDRPILIVSRQPNSGTYHFFRQHVLEAERYGESARTEPNTEAVVRAVRADRGAIGYGGIAFGPDLRHLSIEGVAPTQENVRNGTYPLSRYLYLYAAGPLEGAVQSFVDWILSDEGQRVAADAGYIPLWDVAAP
jgi:phosphate transport system substrate-binding protein